MKRTLSILASAGTMAFTLSNASIAAADAPFRDPGIPNYTNWQAKWDRAAFRDRHVIVGEVIDFHPYRVQLRRSNGTLQMIDLKHGTRISPTNATPTPGERVALIGYYSQGTFIANHVVIR